MPHNGLGCACVKDALVRKMFVNWKKKSEAVCEYIKKGKSGRIEFVLLPAMIFRFPVFKMFKVLFKIVRIMNSKGIDSLSFAADDTCNGCRICEKICPVNNIQISGSKPIWSDHCAGCFACFHWCSKRSISLGGYDFNIRNYHHPEVIISDILNGVPS